MSFTKVYYFVVISPFPLDFEGGMLALIELVPDHPPFYLLSTPRNANRAHCSQHR